MYVTSQDHEVDGDFSPAPGQGYITTLHFNQNTTNTVHVAEDVSLP